MKKVIRLSTIVSLVLIMCLLIGTGAQATDSVLALMTTGYKQQFVSAFNATVEAAIDQDEGFLPSYSTALEQALPEDESYEFITQTLSYSILEVIAPQIGGLLGFMRSASKEDINWEVGDGGENFLFTLRYEISYEILKPDTLTISERDEILNSIEPKVDELVAGMSNDELRAPGIRETLQASLDKLAEGTSTEFLTLTAIQIQDIEIHDGGIESVL